VPKTTTRSIRTAAAAGLAVLAVSAGANAQTPSPAAIQDNSFLVEEAYNQEPGVVQTIQSYARVAGTGDWAYTLTQEWPVPGVKHQLSFSVPVQGLSGPIGVAKGLGDFALNYRYQLVGSGETAVALSPRATFLVPTGDYRRALGSGGFGLQVSVPLSVVLSRRLVAHTNVGATLVLSAKDAEGDRRTLTNLNAGQSLVWLAHPNVNVLVEAVIATNETIGGGGVLIRQTAEAVSPGVRAALNLPGDVQIVPGLAVPIGIGSTTGQRSLFLYLSVELPVWHPKKS
jgi:hypothetical protein